MFGEYELHWESAVREHIFGRAKGIFIGVRRTVKDNIVVKREEPFFNIFVKTTVQSVRIIPVYLNFSNWNEQFGILQEYLNANYSDKIMVIGDLNGRTGNGQVLDDDMVNQNAVVRKNRISEDLNSNSNGNKLLDMFEELSLVILNGRFNGDYDGKFTFHGVMGKSVIDYCVATKSTVVIIKKFEIG